MFERFKRQPMQDAKRDDTYEPLPLPGETDPDKLATAVLIAQRFRTESATARGKYLGGDGEHTEFSENLFHFGRGDGSLEDDRPTINRIRKTLDAFEASATRTSPSMTIKVSSAHEDGYWVMTKPFTFHAPTDPQTGQPMVNPNTGMPYVDVPLAPGARIPEEIVDQVPSHRRICIDAPTIVKWEQVTFDVIRALPSVDLDHVVQQLIHNKQIVGWQTVLFEWDPVSQLPEFQVIPARQWYLDPMASSVEKMNRVALDMVVDADSAKRKYPQAAEQIAKAASLSLRYAAGQMGYDPIYTREIYSTPIVTMAITWLRNQQVPMTLDEAIEAALVTVEHADDEEDTSGEGDQAAEATETQATEPQDHEAGDAGGDDDDSAQPRVTKITHAKTGANLTRSFDKKGEPAKKLHADHPHKNATVQWLQIDDEVVPGTYVVCPHWDIPVILDKNTEVMYQPFAYPETVSLKSPQYVINSMFEATVSHAQWFAGPTTLVSKEIADHIDGDFTNGFAQPGRCFTFDSFGDPSTFDIGKHYLLIQPPPMPAALPAVLADVQHSYELIADAGVNNGTPPPDVKSGKAIIALQSQSQNTNDLKSLHTERALKRAANLMLHAQTRWMSIEKILKMNASVPADIVREHFVPLRKKLMLDVEVSLATGGGQVKQQRDQQMFAYYQAQLVDEETAQEALDLPSEEIGRRKAELRKKMLAEQVEAQAKAAPQGPAQPPGPNISISVGYQYLQPEAQSGVLQMMGLPPLQGDGMTVDHKLQAAKLQTEDKRTENQAATTLLAHHHKTAQMRQDAAQAAQEQAQPPEQPQTAGA